MRLRIALFCVLGGLPLLIGTLGTGHFLWWWVSGVVLAATFVPIALFGPRTMLGQFGAIALALLIVTSFCTWSEALIFLPPPEMRQHPLQFLVGSSVLYMIVAVVLAMSALILKLSRESVVVPKHHSPAAAIPRVLLSGIAYVLYYLVFGAITYEFFTKGYYPEAAKIVEKLGLWFWAIQIGRGVLMTVAVLPIIYTLRMRRCQTAVVVGLVIWIAGGLAPLLVPNPYMNDTQRFIHIVEIFTQNFPLGVTAVLLLRPKEPARSGTAVSRSDTTSPTQLAAFGNASVMFRTFNELLS